MAKEQSFSNRLKTWRGGRTQKEAAFELSVDVDVYRKWEQGQNEPHESPSMREIEHRMEVLK